jgi:hypothetical protein
VRNPSTTSRLQSARRPRAEAATRVASAGSVAAPSPMAVNTSSSIAAFSAAVR